MRETKRVIRSAEALDGVSDHMGEILRRADELLADWSRFGAQVRAQVDREAQQLGHAVARAVDDAVARATTTGVDRAIADQIGAKLSALSTEIVKLESRTRAASRAIAEEKRGDRRVLWGVAVGVLAANGLLLALLLRTPAAPTIVQPEPTRIEPAATPVDAALPQPPTGATLETDPATPDKSVKSDRVDESKSGTLGATKADPSTKSDHPGDVSSVKPGTTKPGADKSSTRSDKSDATKDRPTRVKHGPPSGSPAPKLLAVPPRNK